MLRRPLVVWGPPASGKSTLARALAAALGCDTVDLDDLVAREAGTTVTELFAREGEAGFRARERRALAAAMARAPSVIAVGAGALVDRASRHATLRAAHVLVLRAPLETLAIRAQGDGATRPLLAGDDPAARLAALLDARAEAYAEAHAHVDATGAPAAVLQRARDAIAALEADRATLVAPAGSRSYRVHVASRSTLATHLATLVPSATVLVTDRRVQRALSLDETLGGWTPVARVVQAGRGDRDKTLAGIRAIWNASLDAAIDRDAVLVGVGGGVVMDMTGFAAATLLRGVRWIAAPTTLLAMVDASVGGKTGFDPPQGKNLIGAFHPPAMVLCDPDALATTSQAGRREGLAEIAKIALVRDVPLLEQLERDASRLRDGDLEAFAALVAPSIQAKIDVVARDERESGERALLNFGHTLGHAFERASGYTLAHGDAVAVGMRAALSLGVRLGVTPVALADRARSLFEALDLPARPPRLDRATVMAALGRDKKRRAGSLRFVLCDAPGSGVLQGVSSTDVERTLDELREIRPRPRRPLRSR